ncbi:MAG TPA: dihydrofolate reductase family protein [Chitinophagaceae bacterium]|nr:dihydrofolate reductase family protein [Chitinophagaceae bacterium]
MRKLIAAINMSLDGFCDHTGMVADDETHQHYNELLKNTGILLYGRVTYQLMESHWPLVVQHPTGNKPVDEFGVLIDNIPKIVYSRTMSSVSWKNSTLRNEVNREEILDLKGQTGKNMVVGSPGLIDSFTMLGLVDEYQLMVHPVILGKGLPLFRNIPDRVQLELFDTKKFNCGAIVLYYGGVKLP